MPLNKLIIFSLLFVLTPSAHAAGNKKDVHWSYTGPEGPKHWGELSKSFATCSVGKKQSPINIKNLGNGTAPRLTLSYHSTPLSIVDNGFTLKVNTAPGNSLFLNGEEYHLLQFHYHNPSEHHLNDKSFPMEIHFVHQNKKGDYLALGVFVEEGEENSEFAKIIAHKPEQERTVFDHKNVSINLKNLIRSTVSYYEYQGSFTTPPCTEGVHWFVLKTPITLSKEQIKILSAVHHQSERPLQNLQGRKVYQAP